VDNKGRVNIPAKMRRVLTPEAMDTFVLTRGVDKCIAAYPLDEWKKYEERFSKLNQYSERERFFLRSVLQWSEEAEIDGQQRISLPRKLQEFANISTKAVIVGMVDHIEFWNPEDFELYMNGFATSYEEAAASVMAPKADN
jgi:MraZ protein